VRKVFLENLPKKAYGNTEQIDWKNSIGYEINFIYDEISGVLEIISYSNNKLSIKYNNLITEIGTHELRQGKISFIINIITNKFKLNVGDIITTKTGQIKILKCIRKRKNNNYTQKGYVYECLNDGNVDYLSETSIINQNVGCNVCYNRKTIRGINDISTTAPDLIKYLSNTEDAYNHNYQ
jgi:hypothetical protein